MDAADLAAEHTAVELRAMVDDAVDIDSGASHHREAVTFNKQQMAAVIVALNEATQDD